MLIIGVNGVKPMIYIDNKNSFGIFGIKNFYEIFNKFGVLKMTDESDYIPEEKIEIVDDWKSVS
jgi:hypothetical protein